MSTPSPAPGASAPLDLPAYDLSFVDAITRGFRKYVAFDGRASRREFWYWYAFVTGVLVVLLVPSAAIAAGMARQGGGIGPVFALGFGVTGLFYAAVLLPTLAVACRRLHDAGFSGMFLLLGLVTGLIPLVMCMLPTSPNASQFGPPGRPGEPVGGFAPPGPAQLHAPPSPWPSASAPPTGQPAPLSYGRQTVPQDEGQATDRPEQA